MEGKGGGSAILCAHGMCTCIVYVCVCTISYTHFMHTGMKKPQIIHNKMNRFNCINK